eukprot:scaffold431497_cov18-Prasinocladus_malaysianus.AAC.1
MGKLSHDAIDLTRGRLYEPTSARDSLGSGMSMMQLQYFHEGFTIDAKCKRYDSTNVFSTIGVI